MEQSAPPFEFMQCVSILRSTGRKARTLTELRDIIAEISETCIYHHVQQYFLKQRILEYTNDFAHWAGESLEERALAEAFCVIDPYDFNSIADLRKRLIEVIDQYLWRFPEPRPAMAGEEFCFNDTVELVFPVGVTAKNLAEFLIAVRFVDEKSIYYHFYAARMRLARHIDDFSEWIEKGFRKLGLARRIGAVDPFMHTIEGIRQHIIEEVEREVEKDMAEAVS